MALATLVGGTRSAKEARDLLAATPRLRNLPPLHRDQLFVLMRRLYRRDGGIDALRPDLLGEQLVAEAPAADDELLDVALGPASPSAAARHALTVLTRLAQHAPAERQWLKAGLQRHLSLRLREAVEVGMETGSPLPELLAEVIAQAPRSASLAAVNELRIAIPKETANLTTLAAEVARLHVSFVEDKGNRKGRKALARLLAAYESLAHRLRGSGQFKEAADASVQAVRWARAATKSGSDADRRVLGSLLINASIDLSRIGDHTITLSRAEQAEAIWGELAARQPEAHRPDWAASLVNLANRLSDLGRFEGALAQAQQAEAIWRELAARQPDAHRADWATSLGNLARRLSNLGRFEEALAQAEQAEAIRRELAARQPDAHRPDWASSLDNFANRLGDLGRFEEVLVQAEQAEAIWRELAARQPDAHRSAWAISLGHLAITLNHLGRFEEALAQAEQAEAIRRELAARQPDAYSTDWAWTSGQPRRRASPMRPGSRRGTTHRPRSRAVLASRDTASRNSAHLPRYDAAAHS